MSERPRSRALRPAERRLIQKLRTPAQVQRYLNALPYNTEPPPDPATLRTFRGVVARHTAHCLEAALFAAVVLEAHGYPPLVMSLESIDGLDHVIFIYKKAGRWGSVARSRDPGLHGRKPVFKSLGQMARTYFEPFIDRTGCLKAYGAVDLRVLEPYEWRFTDGNVWKVERMLFEIPHRPIRSSKRRVARLRARYLNFIKEHPGVRPVHYYDRRTWSELPHEFR